MSMGRFLSLHPLSKHYSIALNHSPHRLRTTKAFYYVPQSHLYLNSKVRVYCNSACLILNYPTNYL